MKHGRPNNAMHADSSMTLRFHFMDHLLGAGDGDRSAHFSLMKQLRSEIFTAAAEKLEARSKVPGDKDDPKWLRRNARVYRQLAVKKEKALLHKSLQKKPGLR